LALDITTLTHPVLGVAKFTKRTLFYATCKLQEIWRIAARAPIWLPKASLASVLTTLTRVLVVIETVSTIGDAPRGKIGTRALDAGIFAMTTVGVPETPAMKSTVLKFSLVTSALGIVHPDLPSPLAISRGRVRGHSFPQFQLPTNDSGFVHIEAVITDGSPLAIVEDFHASLGRGIEPHKLNVGNTADNLVGLTGAVNDARILEKMFSLGTFGAVVGLFDAVRAVF